MSNQGKSEGDLSVLATRKYDGLAFVNHMIAGATAGTMEHTVMYPVDTIKTRMQALSHPGQRLHSVSVRQALRSAIKREGLSGLYKGVGVVAAGAGPAHAMHFAVYELSKELMGGNKGSGHHPAIAAVSGILATVVNEGIMTPVDVVKQRLQGREQGALASPSIHSSFEVTHSPYKGVLDCIQTMARNEGLYAFFKSYRTTLVMNVPFHSVHFAIYEGTKKVLLQPLLWKGAAAGDVVGALSEDDSDILEDSLSTQVFAGGLAGGVAAALTTPLDVVKTRLQTEGVHSATRYGGTAIIPTLRRIIKEEGTASIWRGLKPRVLVNTPAAAVCWGTYETMKKMLADHE